MFYNVDVIKVTVGDDISVPELTAVVEEAHRQHLKVAVHAVDTPPVFKLRLTPAQILSSMAMK